MKCDKCELEAKYWAIDYYFYEGKALRCEKHWKELPSEIRIKFNQF